MTALGKIAVLRKFFATPERPLTTSELKKLSPDERMELAKLAAAEMGVELES